MCITKMSTKYYRFSLNKIQKIEKSPKKKKKKLWLLFGCLTQKVRAWRTVHSYDLRLYLYMQYSSF